MKIILSTLLTYCSIFIIFSTILNPAHAQKSNNVYMIAKAKVVNTTYTSIVVFQNKNITNLAACEKERQRGFQNRWRYYGHAVKRFTGISMQVNYFCVTSDHSISEWWHADEYKYVYLVNIGNGTLSASAQNTYANCMTNLRKTQSDDSERRFCAKGNQSISK